MYHDRLKTMKETLMCAVEMQLCDLGDVDTKELGEAIDMIKDLEEAIYYCTVTEAMNQGDTWEMKKGDRHQEEQYNDSRMYYQPRMYMDGPAGTSSSSSHTGTRSGASYMEEPYRTHWRDESEHMKWRNEPEHMNYRDEREGRSYNSRKMYMEAKDMNKDKATQLRELEKYMQELSQDVTEMIADASPEEKQYLEKKITALASKVGQMK